MSIFIYKRLIFLLPIGLLLFCKTYSQDTKLLIDGNVEDWQLETRKKSYTDTLRKDKGVNLKSLSVSYDQAFLYVKFSLDKKIALTGGNPNKAKIYLYLDADLSDQTGYQFKDLGAELGINFHQKIVYWNPDDKTFNFNELGIRLMPTVTSKHFELAIPKILKSPKGDQIRIEDSVALKLREKVSEKTIPPGNKQFFYGFNKKPIPYPEPISPNHPDTPTFRVMTWNVLNNGLTDPKRDSYFVKVFKRLKPGIVTLNECWEIKPETASSFFNQNLSLPGKEKWVAVKKGQGNITVSRFPILKSWQLKDHFRLTATLHDLPQKVKLPEKVLIINAHLSCCQKTKDRQQEVKAFQDFINEAQKSGGRLTLPPNTPIILAGDLNLVGKHKTLQMVKKGFTQKRFKPDWDWTSLTSVKARHTHSRMTFTWENRQSEWPAGKLDYILYTDSRVSPVKSFTLNSETYPANIFFSNEATVKASDHLPLVADFISVPLNSPSEKEVWINSVINSDKIFLKSGSAFKHLQILNKNGKTVKNKFLIDPRNSCSIEIDNLKVGSYFLHWENQKGQGVKKFLKMQ